MIRTSSASNELGTLFFRELSNIIRHETWTPAQRTDAVHYLLELIFLEVTRKQNIPFTTTFARIAYAGHIFQLDKKLLFQVHIFRKKYFGSEPAGEDSNVYLLGLKVVSDCIQSFFGTEPPSEVSSFLPDASPFAYTEVPIREFRKKVRVLALKDDESACRLLARDEENPAENIWVQYNLVDRNEPFNATIRQIRHSIGFPVTLNLLDVEVDETGLYRPRAFVVEPDYLIDVTALANCYQGASAEPVVYLLQKFLPVEPGIPLILGNIANYFLDELMNNPKADFRETFPKVFKTNPLTFSLLNDREILEIRQKSQRHWVTLQSMVWHDMKKAGIEPKECFLEPSFYDETHGLQGRLDILYRKERKSAIIELKSGKPYMANQHGIGASHFIQTLLYDLMVRAVYPEDVDPACYILYSGLETNQLKYAPPVKSAQYEALQLRNQLLAIDHLLAANGENASEPGMLGKIKAQRFPHLKGFARKNIETFEQVYGRMDEQERKYFDAFSGFIAREHRLAKTGIQGVEQVNGLASLWLDSPEEKESQYKIIRALRILENRANEEEAVILFERTAATNPLANFRSGDIAVLYPSSGTDTKADPSGHSPLSSQIFKVTITGIDPLYITVRLRYKQFNPAVFEAYTYWNLEHDQMDMSFQAMYQGLFRWASSRPDKRALMLTTRPPVEPHSVSSSEVLPEVAGMTEEQRSILEKMIRAQEYFLLWGPPGTGKTSQMLKHFAAWVFRHTQENLLLLAYTNRAVDEICEALEELGPAIRSSYIRIGSSHAAGDRFQDRLLSHKIAQVNRREELKEILNQHRVFVSTLASLSNNLELLQLKPFRRVVIDEASQILEPQLVGLLPSFEQFILIGDHKQLPAVVVQDVRSSAVTDEGLCSLGLQNLRNSLFERMYKRCTDRGWTWAYGLLSHQGRMHREIMQFPCEYFYEGKLKILPGDLPYAMRQQEAIHLEADAAEESWTAAVRTRRLVFLSTPVDWETPSRKTNQFEAERIAGLVRFFRTIYKGVEPEKSIGIITPYRAQIAQIREILQREQIESSDITIDTVERYQGGARDIILISLCTNAATQLDSLVSLSEEGVDRKLNVALTRAREHVVILGNKELLSRNEIYRKLIAFCEAL